MSVDATLGGASSNSYISNADVDAYWSARNNTTWSAATSAAQDAALIEATQYLDSKYQWIGYIASTTQSLGWPRTEAYDREGRELSDMIPVAVSSAAAELALQALSGRLVAVGSATGKDTSKEKVGDIEVEYFEAKSASAEYNYVDQLLKSLVINSGGYIHLVRA